MTYWEIIVEIAKFILIIAGSYLVIVHIIPWFETHSESKKTELLKEYIIFAVTFAEQVLSKDPEKNSEKKQFVLNYIIKKVKDIGLDITEQDANIMVESTVNMIKHPTK